MNNITQILNSKNETDNSYWDFKGNSNNSLSNIMKYPAKMVSDMQYELINTVKEFSNAEILLDPFCGSGTSLVEAYKCDLYPIGIDINPLSYLLNQVKFYPYNFEKLKNDVLRVAENYKKDFIYDNFYFEKIEKWFKEEIITNFSKLRICIELENDIYTRKFLWVIFADLIRDKCNSRNSTAKLYIKKIEDIEKIDSNIIDSFLKKSFLSIDSLGKFHKVNDFKESKLFCRNSIELLNNKNLFLDESIDIICTSPPYGDNLTTIAYGQFSVLQLKWINLLDIDKDIDLSIINTMTKLDKLSMGGELYSLEFIEKSGILKKSNEINNIYIKLCNENRHDFARKVGSFLFDYDNYLHESYRILKHDGYQILTLGNRTVNGNLIELDKITIQLSEFYGFKLVWKTYRNILNKRRPQKINKKIQSINKETVLILQK